MHSLELLLLSVSIHSYIHKYTYLLHVWSEMYLSFLVLAKMTKTSTKNTVDIKSASEKNPLHKCVTTQLTLVAATQGLLKKFTYSFRKTYVASRLTCSEQRALHQRNWGRDLDNLFAWLLGGLVNLSIESPLRNDYENHACVFIYIVANQCKAQDGTLIWTLSTTQGRKSQTVRIFGIKTAPGQTGGSLDYNARCLSFRVIEYAGQIGSACFLFN